MRYILTLKLAQALFDSIFFHPILLHIKMLKILYKFNLSGIPCISSKSTTKTSRSSIPAISSETF